MKAILLSILAVIAITSVVGSAIFFGLGAIGSNIPNSPKECTYAIEVTGPEGSITFFSNIKPYSQDGRLLIRNYWWKEYDEEGYPEYLRRNEEVYYMMVPSNYIVEVRVLEHKEINEIVRPLNEEHFK